MRRLLMGFKNMKKLIAGISSAVLVLALSAVATPVLASHTSPGTIFVDDANTCPGTGTAGDPFCDIQLAVDHASSGDTIKVADGTYGNVTIPSGKDGLTLKAGSKPIIDCGAGAVPGGASVGNGITIGSNGVTIRGFEIRNCDNGIASVGSISGALIEKNDVHDSRNPAGGFQGVGIVILGAGGNVGNTITKNKVHDNDRQGIFLGRGCTGGAHDSTGNTICHNTIFDNGLDLAATPAAPVSRGPDASQYGIQLCEAANNVISHNKITDHNAWGFGSGIYLFDSSNNLVSKNKLENNRQGVVLFAGGLFGSSGNTIEKNKIKDGVAPACTPPACAVAPSFPATGFRIFDAISSGNTIEKNHAKNNAGDGFKVGAGVNTFTKNKSEKNTGFGFVEPAVPAGGLYTKNKCKKNGAGGSSTDGGATATGGLCTPQSP